MDEVSVHQAYCEWAFQHYSLEGGGTICLGYRPAGYHTQSEIVTECLLRHSPDFDLWMIKNWTGPFCSTWNENQDKIPLILYL